MIIFGDGTLFNSRQWRLHSDYQSETLGYSKQTCQGEAVIKWCSGDRVYRLTLGIHCGERVVTPARMGPALLLGQDTPSLTL